MKNYYFIETILSELNNVLSKVDELKVTEAIELLLEAKEIFCAGAGRSGFQVKGFAMRLMHMGFKSYVVGETCTPNITEEGLLVVCSGSGETKSLVNHANKANRGYRYL